MSCTVGGKRGRLGMVTISTPGLFWGPYVGFLYVLSACIGHCSYVYDWWEDISCQICVEDSGDGLSFGFCLSSLSYCHVPDQEGRVHSLELVRLKTSTGSMSEEERMMKTPLHVRFRSTVSDYGQWMRKMSE